MAETDLDTSLISNLVVQNHVYYQTQLPGFVFFQVSVPKDNEGPHC